MEEGKICKVLYISLETQNYAQNGPKSSGDTYDTEDTLHTLAIPILDRVSRLSFFHLSYQQVIIYQICFSI